MATRRRFLAEVNKHGATVDESAESYFVVDAPIGKLWRANGCHAIYVDWNHGFTSLQSWKPEAYDSAIEDMAEGITDCDDEHCEYCAERRLNANEADRDKWQYLPDEWYAQHHPEMPR